MKTALTIAGSDSIGGAGIQADIKTMTMNGVYAMSVITALTSQNTMGVKSIFEISTDFLEDQLDAVFEDVFPDAIKIGMVYSSEVVETVSGRLKKYGAKNIVVDPVMVSTSGARLIDDKAVETLADKLFPIADLITPNISEAEILSGVSIKCGEDMMIGAEIIERRYGCAVLCKGGHSINDSNDLLYYDGKFIWLKERRIDNPNTHGTGCTLSSAIASNLAKGFDVCDSAHRAKEYISGALSSMLNIGHGDGPLNHSFDLNGKYAERNN